MNKAIAEGLENAAETSLEYRSEEPGLPLCQPDPCLVADPPALDLGRPRAPDQLVISCSMRVERSATQLYIKFLIHISEPLLK